MIQPDETFIAKARESLEGARLAYEGGRYANCANRSYCACLQAAIHALVIAQVKPPGGGTIWNHGFVRGQFDGLLIKRRHRYSPDLKQVLSLNYELRAQADYMSKAISEIVAYRALRRAERFVAAVALREEGRS